MGPDYGHFTYVALTLGEIQCSCSWSSYIGETIETTASILKAALHGHTRNIEH